MSIGPYILEAPLGAGAMGAVFRAHLDGGSAVAVKVVTTAEGQLAEALEGEARAMAALTHPHVVRIYDAGRVTEPVTVGQLELPAGAPWLAMELASATLGDRPPRGWREVQQALSQVLDALAHAHARDLIHRDVKPSNILWRGDDAVLADFGIAAAFDRVRRERRVRGTLRFMAPEQLAGQGHLQGPPTDLYALGCVAWELLLGRPLFGDLTGEALAQAVRWSPTPTLPTGTAAPAGMDRWLHLCLAKHPDARFATAADARAALDDLERPVAPLRLAPPPRAETTLGDLSAELPAVPPLDDPEAAEAPRCAVGPLEIPPVAPLPLPGVGLALTALREIPTVGRAAERADLWARLMDVVRGGHTQVVVVHGAPGAGSRHLVRQLAADAHAQAGLPVLRGQGTDPVVHAARRHLGLEGLSISEAASQLRERLGRRGATIATMERAEAALSLGGRAARSGLLEAVAHDVRGRPAVMWLDARDGMDPAILDDVRAAPWAALCLVTTGVDPAPLACDAHLALDPLGSGELLELLVQLLRVDPAWAQQLLQRIDSPVLAVEGVRELARQHRLHATPRGFAPADHAVSFPTGIVALWRSRVEDLCTDPAHARALSRLACLGAPVEVDVWEALAETGPLDALVGAARTAHVLHRDLEACRLAPLAREALLARLDADARRGHHQACADWIAQTGLCRGRLGDQLRALGRSQEAITAYLEGTAWVPQAAQIALCLAAIEVLDEIGAPPDHPQRVECLARQAATRAALGQGTAAIEVARACLEVATDPRPRAWAHAALGKALLIPGDLDEAAAQMEAVLAEPQAPYGPLSQALGTLCDIAVGRGQPERALVYAERARALCPTGSLDAGFADARLGTVLHQLGRLREAERAFARARELVASPPGSRAWVLCMSARCALARGDDRGALAELEEALEQDARAGGTARFLIRAEQAAAMARVGDFAEARAILEVASDQLALDGGGLVPSTRAALVLCLVAQEAWERVDTQLDRLPRHQVDASTRETLAQAAALAEARPDLAARIDAVARGVSSRVAGL